MLNRSAATFIIKCLSFDFVVCEMSVILFRPQASKCGVGNDFIMLSTQMQSHVSHSCQTFPNYLPVDNSVVLDVIFRRHIINSCSCLLLYRLFVLSHNKGMKIQYIHVYLYMLIKKNKDYIH